jgi:hypothetical protein
VITALALLPWLFLLSLLAGTVVLAWYASGGERYRLVLIPVAVVTGWVLWALLGGLRLIPHPIVLVLLGIGLVALAVVAGSPLVTLVLRLSSRDSRAGAHGGILVEDEDDGAPREILRGGRTIGYLERLAIAGSVLAGQLGGVAVIVAIKGLGRYSELENAEARERFLIGSLTSLMWAVACVAPIAITLLGLALPVL